MTTARVVSIRIPKTILFTASKNFNHNQSYEYSLSLTLSVSVNVS